MFASNLRNEFADVILGYSGITKNFLLNNSGRSIPTLIRISTSITVEFSFNRINSGRSIPTRWERRLSRVITPRGFNRINSGRSIPTYNMGIFNTLCDTMFQSYQFRQINPDLIVLIVLKILKTVSIVSIQADQSRR